MGKIQKTTSDIIKEFDDKEGGTVFDDVFRTIIEKMPELVIPVINEVFATSYEYDEKITYYKNEHQSKKGKVITDSCLGIKNRLYHIECQSNVDNTMILRMIEYDFAIALENADKKEGYYEMEFPRSCVLYLRHNSKTPEILKMKVKIPGGESFDYEIPIVKVQRYTKDEIFQKRLLMFLPFYIMRYEKEYDLIENEPERLSKLISEYEDIRIRIDKLSTVEEKSVLYGDLKDMIARISDHMLEKRRRLKERIGETMRGQVLELLSEKFAAVEERENAITEKENAITEKENAIAERENALVEKENVIIKKEIEMERKVLLQKMQMLVQLINSKSITVSKAAEMVNLTEAEFVATVKELGFIVNI